MTDTDTPLANMEDNLARIYDATTAFMPAPPTLVIIGSTVSDVSHALGLFHLIDGRYVDIGIDDTHLLGEATRTVAAVMIEGNFPHILIEMDRRDALKTCEPCPKEHPALIMVREELAKFQQDIPEAPSADPGDEYMIPFATDCLALCRLIDEQPHFGILFYVFAADEYGPLRYVSTRINGLTRIEEYQDFSANADKVSSMLRNADALLTKMNITAVQLLADLKSKRFVVGAIQDDNILCQALRQNMPLSDALALANTASDLTN